MKKIMLVFGTRPEAIKMCDRVLRNEMMRWLAKRKVTGRQRLFVAAA